MQSRPPRAALVREWHGRRGDGALSIATMAIRRKKKEKGEGEEKEIRAGEAEEDGEREEKEKRAKKKTPQITQKVTRQVEEGQTSNEK